MNVLALDPGKVVGIAWVWDGAFTSGELRDLDALAWLEVHVPRFDEVTMEQFVINAGTVRKGRDAHWATDVIGCVKWWCAKHDVPLTTRTAAAAKGYASNARLEQLGWRNPSPGGHRDDAARHLLVHLTEAGELRPFGRS